MFEMQPYIVYVKPDAQNRIVAVDSSAFVPDTDGWVEIDSGYGDRYHHAQGNYFPKSLYDNRNICRYLYTPDGESLWRERTQDEMDADYVPPVPQPDQSQRIADLEAAMAAIEEGIASV